MSEDGPRRGENASHGDGAINQVRSRGRVSGAPETRTLPSGDELVSLRLVVDRDAAARRRSRQLVDTIDCVAWRAAVRRSALRLQDGDVVEVEGALRRRFQRGAGGPRSWVSVELGRLRRVRADQ